MNEKGDFFLVWNEMDMFQNKKLRLIKINRRHWDLKLNISKTKFNYEKKIYLNVFFLFLA